MKGPPSQGPHHKTQHTFSARPGPDSPTSPHPTHTLTLNSAAWSSLEEGSWLHQLEASEASLLLALPEPLKYPSLASQAPACLLSQFEVTSQNCQLFLPFMSPVPGLLALLSRDQDRGLVQLLLPSAQTFHNVISCFITWLWFLSIALTPPLHSWFWSPLPQTLLYSLL